MMLIFLQQMARRRFFFFAYKKSRFIFGIERRALHILSPPGLFATSPPLSVTQILYQRQLLA